MYPDYLYYGSAIILVSMFSLAWFLTGLFAGKNVEAVPAPRKRRKVRTKKPASNQVNELYVGNLSYGMSERDLGKVFGDFGRVNSTRIIKNRRNGRSKGFGFVKMSDLSGSKAAVKALHGKEVDGRRLIVKEAQSSARLDS